MQMFEQWHGEHQDVRLGHLGDEKIRVTGAHRSLWCLTDYRVAYAGANDGEDYVIIAKIPDRPPKKFTFKDWYTQSHIHGAWKFYHEKNVDHILFVCRNTPRTLPPSDLADYEVIASKDVAVVLRKR